MARHARSLVIFVIAFHLVVFVVEAFLRMRIYEVALPRFGNAVALGLQEQALTLKPAFVNQGFYNLFLAAAGILGFALLGRGDRQAGIPLMRTCAPAGSRCKTVLVSACLLCTGDWASPVRRHNPPFRFRRHLRPRDSRSRA